MRTDEFMNAEDVARYLNLGKNTVYQLAKSGRIASYHVGRKLKFTLEDVEAYVESTRQSSFPEPVPVEHAAELVPAAEHVLSDAASFGELEGDPFVIAGGDPAADLVASALNALGTPAARLVRGSYTALVNLYAGDADAAVVHLFDQVSNSCNVPYVRNLAPGASVRVFRLYGRNQGLIVQEGNPKKLTTWGGLLRGGVKLANRAKGSGARVLLDEKLRAMDARCDSIAGYGTESPVGALAVARVAEGIADVAIGTEREARHAEGVQFVPLSAEWVDLVMLKTDEGRPVLRLVTELLADQAVRRDFEALGPGDFSRLGAIVYES